MTQLLSVTVYRTLSSVPLCYILQANVEDIITSLCVSAVKLKLGDAALRVDVNMDAVSPLSSPAAHVYSCLQHHITKLQVMWLLFNCMMALCEDEKGFSFPRSYGQCFKKNHLSINVCPQTTFSFIQTVSESLKILADAHSRASSTMDVTPDDAVSTSSLRDPATTLYEHVPPMSESAGSQSPADDIMVQIRAGRSEVGWCQRICQLFTPGYFQSPLYYLPSK